MTTSKTIPVDLVRDGETIRLLVCGTEAWLGYARGPDETTAPGVVARMMTEAFGKIGEAIEGTRRSPVYPHPEAHSTGIDSGHTEWYAVGMTVGERLEEFLDWRAWTQAELARRTGVAQATISKLVRSVRGPSLSLALAIERLTAEPKDDGETWANGPIRADEWVTSHDGAADPEAA